MRQPGEPSVEQILESIKQVLARDGRAPPPSPGPAPLAVDAAPSGDDEVLDLAGGAYGAAEDAAAVEPPADPEPAPASDRVPAPAPAPIAALAPDPKAALLGEHAADTVRGSFDALAALAAPGAIAGTPLEVMVREALGPALAEWLDRNLPPIVERLVAAEIARIVGGRR